MSIMSYVYGMKYKRGATYSRHGVIHIIGYGLTYIKPWITLSPRPMTSLLDLAYIIITVLFDSIYLLLLDLTYNYHRCLI